MHNERRDPEGWPANAEPSDPLACFASFETATDAAVIYDVRNPRAWISSDAAVPIDSIP